MKRTYVRDIEPGEVRVKGYIHELRVMSKMCFFLLRDSSGIVQGIVKDTKLLEQMSDLTLESVVDLTGNAKSANVKAEGVRNDVEIELTKITILSKAEKLPIHVNEKTTSTDLSKRLDHRWLDLRKPNHFFVFRLWTFMEQAMREYWVKNGYTQINTPKFMSAASESGAELFEVDYFGKKAYLAQSPQFFKQMAMSAGFDKVFEIAPAFRANPSNTSRHDTEFTMIDMEISFIDSEEDVMKEEETWINYFLDKINKEYGEEIKKRYDLELIVPKLPFPRITMKEALLWLKKEKDYSPSEEGDLDAEGEKFLSELIKKKYGHEFVFITEYPISVRPFYHMRRDEDPNLTKSFDLIWKGIEITTGAQREHNPEKLIIQAKEKGIAPKSIDTYLNFFKHGCPPHGGCALSPSRILTIMLNLGNVREATFLPRDLKRLNP